MFKNKVVLITGGSGGIGAATAEKFAKEGAMVVIVDTNESKLKEVTERCLRYGSQALSIKADLCKDEESDTVVKQTIEKFGKLDVLVNNAAIIRESKILSADFLDVFDEILRVNLRAVVHMSRVSAPHLVACRGNMVMMSSAAAYLTRSPMFFAYSTSKAALTHFSKCLAAELAPNGVRVNMISPGPVRTSIYQSTSLTQGANHFKAHTALNRISEPEEIADLILYLASDKAGGITGSDYVIDNGILL